MRKALFCRAAFAALIGAAPAAHASTVTFDSLASVNSGAVGNGTTYSENGLMISSSVASSVALYHWGAGQSYNADPGGATLFGNYAPQTLTFSLAGGGDFYLRAFDLGDAYNGEGGAGAFGFSYTDADGIHESTQGWSGTPGLSSFSLTDTALSAFSLTQFSHFFQVDNIVFDPAKPAKAATSNFPDTLNAATVTFSPLASANGSAVGDGRSYSENGLTITSDIDSPIGLYHWGTSQSYNADAGGATLFGNYAPQTFTFTRTGGGAFFLKSFDLGDAYNGAGGAGSFGFSYTDDSGTHSSIQNWAGHPGFDTFSLTHTALTAFTLTQFSHYFQFDNIVFAPFTAGIDDLGGFGAVPEPANWALMIAGFGLVGGVMRRRPRARLAFS